MGKTFTDFYQMTGKPANMKVVHRVVSEKNQIPGRKEINSQNSAYFLKKLEIKNQIFAGRSARRRIK